MQSLLLPLCVVLFIAGMALRIRLMPPDKQPRTPQQRMKFVRVLVGGLLVWMVIYYNLQRQIHTLDGKSQYTPGLMERIVRFFAG